MLGGRNQMQDLSKMINPTTTPVGDSLVGTKTAYASEDNTNNSIFWWLGLFIVFVLYGWLQNKNSKVQEQLKPANLSANLHNIFFVTFAALIGLVAGKILFIKVAAWTKNIPILGKSMSYLAQLFAAV